MEYQGKWFGFPMLAFHFQWSDHHIRGRSEEGFHPSLYDLGLEQPKADTLPHRDQLINAHPQESPTGTFIRSLCPLRSGNGHAQLAGKQSHHPRSGPRCGEAVYLTLVDNVDQSANSADPTTKGTLYPKSDSSGTTRNTMSSSYSVIPRTCTRKMTNPSGLVRIPPSPTRFTG